MLKRSKKIGITVAAVLIITGLIVSCVAFALLDFDFKKLNTVNVIGRTFDIADTFESIYIEDEECDITLAQSVDGKCSVTSLENDKIDRQVFVEGGCLKISYEDNSQWFQNIGMDFNEYKLTVYLPKSEYKKLYISTDSGNINIPNSFKFEDLDIESETGNIYVSCDVTKKLTAETDISNLSLKNLSPEIIKIESDSGYINLKNISCRRISVETDMGDMKFENLVAKENIIATSDVGIITLTDCDSETLNIKTEIGNINGSLKSEKTFIAHSELGNVIVPQTASGGKCEVKSYIGDIYFEILPSYN